MSSKRNASMIIGISMGQETCLIHGKFHSISLWEAPSEGFLKPGGRLPRKQLQYRPDHYGHNSGRKLERMPSCRRRKWSHEKRHLDNERKFRGIYFIEPEDNKFEETIKNARKKLETQVAPSMHCKIMKKNCGRGASNKSKNEARESTRLREGESLPHHHQDNIAGKYDNSLQYYNSVHKFILLPQAMKIPAAKAAVHKEWEKMETIPAWNVMKVRSKKEVIWSMKQRRKAQKFITPHWWTCVIWRMLNWKQNTINTMVEWYSEVIL